VCRVHLDKAEDGEIVAFFDIGKVGGEQLSEPGLIDHAEKRCRVFFRGKEPDAVFLKKWRSRGEAAGLVVTGHNLAGGDLGGFDIRLVKRVDAHNAAGDGGGKFPAIEFGGDVEPVGELDADDRVAGGVECAEIDIVVGGAGELEINEDPVGAIAYGGLKRFALDGDDRLAVLAGRFSDEL